MEEISDIRPPVFTDVQKHPNQPSHGFRWERYRSIRKASLMPNLESTLFISSFGSVKFEENVLAPPEKAVLRCRALIFKRILKIENLFS